MDFSKSFPIEVLLDGQSGTLTERLAVSLLNNVANSAFEEESSSKIFCEGRADPGLPGQPFQFGRAPSPTTETENWIKLLSFVPFALLCFRTLLPALY